VKNGVPFDVAFSLEDTTAVAWCIVFSEMEGHTFDWNAMAFKKE